MSNEADVHKPFAFLNHSFIVETGRKGAEPVDRLPSMHEALGLIRGTV